MIGETTPTISGDEARQLIDDLPLLPPDAQAGARERLAAYREQLIAAERKQADAHFEKVFTDDNEFQKLTTSAMVSTAAEVSPFPKSVGHRSANIAYFAHRMDRPLEDVQSTYETLRDGFAKSQGVQGVVTDEAVFGMIRSGYQDKKKRTEALTKLQMQSVTKALQDANSGEPRPVSETFEKWIAENPDLVDADNEAGFYAQARDLYYGTLAESERLSGPAGSVWKQLSAFTEGDAGDGDVLALAESLAGMSLEDRRAVYGMATTAAIATGEAQAPLAQIADNFSKSFTRGFDFLPKGALAAQEDAANLWLNTFRTGRFTMRDTEDGPVPVAGDYFGKSGTREPTEEEQAELIAKTELLMPAFQIAREMKALAKEGIDPIKPIVDKSEQWLLGSVERGAYGLTGSLGMLGAYAISPVIGTLAIYNEEYDTLRVQNPDMDIDAARGLAALSAGAQGVIEKFQLDSITGKLPVFASLMKDMKKGWGRAGATAGLSLIEQNIQEGAQDAISMFLPVIAVAVREDMPDVDLEAVVSDYIDARSDVFFAVLPLAMVAGGAAKLTDFKGQARAAIDPQILEFAGFSREQMERIASADTQDEMDAVIQKEWKARNPDDIAAGKQKAESFMDAAKAELQGEGSPTVETRTAADGSREYVVTGADGKVLATTRSEDAAAEVVRDAALSKQEAKRVAVRDMVTFFQNVNTKAGRVDNAQTFEISDAPKSFQRVLESGDVPIEQLHERMRIAGYDPATTPLGEVMVFGENVAEVRDNVFSDTIKIYQGADPLVVVEERVEGETKRAIANGSVTTDWLRSQVQSYEAASGEQLIADGMDSEQSVIEAVSTLGKAYIAGRIRDPQLPPGLRGYFRQMVEFFKDVFARAGRLRKAIAEGKVSGDFESFLAQSVGLDVEQQISVARDNALAKTFSIGVDFKMSEAEQSGQPSQGGQVAGFDADYLAAVESGDMETAQKMVDEAARAAGFGDSGVLIKDYSSWPPVEIPFPTGRKSNVTDSRAYNHRNGVFLGEKVSVTELEKAFKKANSNGNVAGWRMVESEEAGVPNIGDEAGVSMKWKWGGNNYEDPSNRPHHALSTTKKIATAIGKPSNYYPGDVLILVSGKSSRKARFQADDGERSIAEGIVAGVWFRPNPGGDFFKIKSADPVTRDEQGNVIPLSQRFNAEDNRITYAIGLKERADRIEKALSKVDNDPEFRREQIKKSKKRLREIWSGMTESPKLPAKQQEAAIKAAKDAHSTELADLKQQESEAVAGETDAKKINGIRLGFISKQRAADRRLEAALASITGKTANRADMIKAFGELEAIIRILPMEARVKVGGYKKLAEFKTDAGRISFLEDRIAKVGEEMEQWLRKDTRERINKLLKRTRPKKGDNRVLKSTLGSEAQKAADWAYNASLMDDTETATALADIEALITGGGLTPERQSALIEQWSITNLFGDLENRNAIQLEDALEWLETTTKAGRNSWRIQEEARREEYKARSQQIVKGLGKPSRAKLVSVEQQTGWSAFKNWLSAADMSHYSFLQILERVLPQNVTFLKELQTRARIADTKSQDFERAASDRLMSALQPIVGKSSRAMANALWEVKKIHTNAVEALNGRVVKQERISIDLAEKIVAGTANRGTLSSADIKSLRDELAKLPADTAKKYVSIDRVVDAGEMEFVPMSKLDAIQYLLSWNQSDVRAKMEREGWSESSVKQMEELTADSVSQGVMKFLRAEYDASHGKVNPIYRAQFGMNMPQGENYAPTRFRHAKDAADISPFGGPLDTTGVTPGFAKARVSHSAMMRQMDSLTVYWQHVAQQSHFIHYSELTRDLRAVFTNPDVRASMEQTFGKSELQQVDYWIDAIATKGASKSNELLSDTQLLSNLISAKSVSSLGGSLRTIAMQVDAAMRFLFAMPPKRIFQALADLPGVIKSMPESWERESVQRRVINGATPEARYLFEQQRIRPSTMLRMGELSMLPMQYADGFLTSFTGAIVYRDAHREAIKAGASASEADAAAADAMDDAIYRFAQPVGLTSRSLREVSGNRAIKLFMMFMSDARLKTALYTESIRGLATGTGDTGVHIQRILAINAMAMVSHTVSNLFRDAFGDDPDDEIWTIEGYLKAALMAPLSGYFLAGAAWDVATSRALGMHAFNTSQNPLVGSLESAYRAASNIEDVWNPDDPDAMMREWNAIARSVAVYGPGSAVPAVIMNVLKPIIGAIENVKTPEDEK